MEVLKPEPAKESVSTQLPPQPRIEGLPDIKQLEILSALGMKSEIFNEEAMEKVAFISERLDENIDELLLKLGNDDWSHSKLDKLFFFYQLKDQEKNLERKRNIIKQQLNEFNNDSI